MNFENKTYKTPLEDLRKSNLDHYEEVSSKAHHWSSGVPKAINFYYDYKSLGFWGRIRKAFKL